MGRETSSPNDFQPEHGLFVKLVDIFSLNTIYLVSAKSSVNRYGKTCYTGAAIDYIPGYMLRLINKQEVGLVLML